MVKKYNNDEINIKKLIVNPKNLRWQCPESIFKFKSTSEIKPLDKIVGQPRAIKSIKLGAEIQSKGYNIFVTGLSGTGRLTTVKNVLEKVNTSKPILHDYCYVYNFANPDEPMLLTFLAGHGKKFAKNIDDVISYLLNKLSTKFDDEDYIKNRNKIIEKFQSYEKRMLDDFDSKINPKGFVRGNLENEQGIVVTEIFPIIEGKAVHIDTIKELIATGKLTKNKGEEIFNLYTKFHNELKELQKQGFKNLQEFQKALYEYDKAVSSEIMGFVFEPIIKEYTDEKIKLYIENLKANILENLQILIDRKDQINPFGNEDIKERKEEILSKYKVNVILDNAGKKEAPIIVETTPTYTNLFGSIERTVSKNGTFKTSHMQIKAGSILKADRGYLIVNALDLFQENEVWNTLKRVLLYDKLEIQTFETIFQMSQITLKPEPINVKVKVIIIGGQTLYYWLWYNEKGFKKIFKVNAQFDYETKRTYKMLQNYSRFISKICKEENLNDFSPDGVAKVIEWAVELAGSQNRITLKFSDVADIVRESSYLNSNNKKLVEAKEVEKAIEERRYRNNLLEEKIKSSIYEGDLLIDTKGERVGQINALTVLDTGVHSFGTPSRITGVVSAGDSEIINIEREINLSGAIHSKGVLILTAFFKERFSKNKPLSISASITFEQNYGGVDGDSATAAEIYCLLSSISGIPIKQSIAVTGSVNQKGDIQPIGGVNEKIRGFFDVCKKNGLDGSNGVIIPKQNVKDLMLPEEIIQAVKTNKFKIFAITKVEEGIPILMNIKPGKLLKNKSYTPNSLFDIVSKKLDEFRAAKKKKRKIKTSTKEIAERKNTLSLEEVLKLEDLS